MFKVKNIVYGNFIIKVKIKIIEMIIKNGAQVTRNLLKLDKK